MSKKVNFSLSQHYTPLFDEFVRMDKPTLGAILGLELERDNKPVDPKVVMKAYQERIKYFHPDLLPSGEKDRADGIQPDVCHQIAQDIEYAKECLLNKDWADINIPSNKSGYFLRKLVEIIDNFEKSQSRARPFPYNASATKSAPWPRLSMEQKISSLYDLGFNCNGFSKKPKDEKEIQIQRQDWGSVYEALKIIGFEPTLDFKDKPIVEQFINYLCQKGVRERILEEAGRKNRQDILNFINGFPNDNLIFKSLFSKDLFTKPNDVTFKKIALFARANYHLRSGSRAVSFVISSLLATIPLLLISTVLALPYRIIKNAFQLVGDCIAFPLFLIGTIGISLHATFVPRSKFSDEGELIRQVGWKRILFFGANLLRVPIGLVTLPIQALTSSWGFNPYNSIMTRVMRAVTRVLTKGNYSQDNFATLLRNNTAIDPLKIYSFDKSDQLVVSVKNDPYLQKVFNDLGLKKPDEDNLNDKDNLNSLNKEDSSQNNPKKDDSKSEKDNSKKDDAKPETNNLRNDDVKSENDNSKKDDVKPETNNLKKDDVKPETNNLKKDDVKPETNNLKKEDVKPETNNLKKDDVKPENDNPKKDDLKNDHAGKGTSGKQADSQQDLGKSLMKKSKIKARIKANTHPIIPIPRLITVPRIFKLFPMKILINGGIKISKKKLDLVKLACVVTYPEQSFQKMHKLFMPNIKEDSKIITKIDLPSYTKQIEPACEVNEFISRSATRNFGVFKTFPVEKEQLQAPIKELGQEQQEQANEQTKQMENENNMNVSQS